MFNDYNLIKSNTMLIFYRCCSKIPNITENNTQCIYNGTYVTTYMALLNTYTVLFSCEIMSTWKYTKYITIHTNFRRTGTSVEQTFFIQDTEPRANIILREYAHFVLSDLSTVLSVFLSQCIYITSNVLGWLLVIIYSC